MRKKQRTASEQDEAQLLSRELAWLEAVSHHRAEVIFGVPMHCPTAGCGDFGLVEAIDGRRQQNRCWSCGATWTLSRQALRLFAQAQVATEPTTIVGAGTLVADLEPANAARTTRERFVGVRSVLHRDRDQTRPAPPAGYVPNA
jgi:hypothetical protein